MDTDDNIDVPPRVGAAHQQRRQNPIPHLASHSVLLEDSLPPISFPFPIEDSEIVGGVETSEFLECCAVGGALEFFCTGTLIAPQWVITAKHCKNVKRVLFGRSVFNLTDAEVIPVIAFYVHPELDLRLLKLANNASPAPRRLMPVVQTGNVTQPAIATVVGFGTTDSAGLFGYGVKRKTDVPIVSMNCASESDKRDYGCKQTHEMVAGIRGLQKDTCKGDSGGPLYVKLGNDDYVLLGVTSRATSNAQTMCGDGGVYVRIDLCRTWIKEITGETL